MIRNMNILIVANDEVPITIQPANAWPLEGQLAGQSSKVTTCHMSCFLEAKYETGFLWKWFIKRLFLKEISRDKQDDRVKRICFFFFSEIMIWVKHLMNYQIYSDLQICQILKQSYETSESSYVSSTTKGTQLRHKPGVLNMLIIMSTAEVF